MPTGKLKLIVGIATAGRRDVLGRTLQVLARQDRLPDRLVICPASEDDVDCKALNEFPAPSAVVHGSKGLTAQRNAILRACSDEDIIVFFDDDFFPSPSYLSEVEAVYCADRAIVAATGHVIADGANGPGLTVEEGLAFLASDRPDARAEPPRPCYGAYGCNMTFRLDVVQRHDIVFDERLSLYGWQEDIDFARRLVPYGLIVYAPRLRGVHLGVKSGRTSGVRFGYSQIVNPIYLARKGTFSWLRASRFISRNVAANLVKSFTPELWIDRRGRLRGNLIGLGEVIRGRADPEKILNL